MLSAKHFLSCRGSLTVQFLLGFVLILIFVMLFSVMTFTLAVSEVTQYITYAASRALFLSSIDKDAQQAAANEKYDFLRRNPPFDKFFQADVIRIAEELSPGTGLGLNRNFPVLGGDPNLFYGVWTQFVPKVLEVDTLWGSTEEEENFFETAVGSYLGRESTISECKKFIDERWNFIERRLSEIGSDFSSIRMGNPVRSYNGQKGKDNFYDNGC